MDSKFINELKQIITFIIIQKYNFSSLERENTTSI